MLVGALSLLALLVAVFLAYTANSGLPFVPTRQLKVDIADGSDVVIGADVREGGFRVGLVSDMKPVELSSGQVGAQLTLDLDQSNGKVPADSRVSIQPLSVLGLKYVALSKGSSSRLLGTDPHTPGDQGPTYKGRAHVPAGETFTRNPTTGPQLASVAGNP